MIWLLRHGDAEDGADDDARPLTEHGREQGRNAGRALAALGAELDVCLTSPKVRALEMARLACEPLGVEVEESEALAAGAFDPLALTEGRGNVLLVGHEPDFSSAIARLTGARIELKKGGLACVERPDLLALLRPEQIELIAR